MNLIIDQGNTATKLAIFEDMLLGEKKIFDKGEKLEVEKWIAENVPVEANVLISAVTDQILSINNQHIIYLNSDTPIPILNKYETPETLGNDRLANAVAIWKRSGGKDALCIDMGTCIKYDLVIDQQFLGGNISPGMAMRYRALNEFTDQLPLMDAGKPGDFTFNYGTTTESSLKNGVEHAIFHEIKGFIERYQEQFGELTIFMTGGDYKFFDKAFKNTIFAVPFVPWADLTICGLNEILRYNVKA